MEANQRRGLVIPELLIVGAVVAGTVWASGKLNPVLSFTISVGIFTPGIIFYLRKTDNENQENREKIELIRSIARGKRYEKFTYTSIKRSTNSRQARTAQGRSSG